MMPNAFSTYAEAAKPTHQARREAAADRRAVTRRRQAEEAQIRKEANAIERRELMEVLAGSSGPAIEALRRKLRVLAIGDAPALIAWIEGSHALRHAPEDVRYLALRLANRAIARVRLREGLVPFDDGIALGAPNDDPRRAGLVLKQLLGVR